MDLLDIAEVSGCWWAVEAGKDFYNRIIRVGHGESELLCSLLFIDRSLLIQSPTEVLRRTAIWGGPLV